MPPKILLVTHYFPAHKGGVEIVAGELAKRVAGDHGMYILWFASDVDSPPEDEKGLRCLPVSAWNITEKAMGIPFPFWGLGAALRLWKALDKADWVHMHDSLYPGSLLAFLLAKWRRVPVLVTQHIGLIPYNSRLLRTILGILNRTVARLVLSQADRVVFISRGVESYFGSFCRYRTMPSYIPNGVDNSVFREVSDDRRKVARLDLQLSPKSFIFLFVGRFVEKKGLSILRQLAARFPDDTWVFAGHGLHDPDSWGLANVRVIRGRNSQELVPYYQAADLLVLPSKGEGFPLVVQEAMACGTPVLVGEDTAQGCPAAQPLMFAEMVGGDDTMDRWATRIEAIRAAPDSLRTLRCRVGAFARQHWSWEATAKAYANAFASTTVNES